MKQLNPYLHFNGNCRDAMTFYQGCLGGELTFMTNAESPLAEQMPDAANEILHASLTTGAFTMLASDMRTETSAACGTISLMLACNSEQELNLLFSKFSEHGTVHCEVGPQFWGAIFGACTDKFGINWLLEYSEQPRALKVEAMGEREIVLTRAFDAPRAAVWSALSQPELLRQWWGGGATTIDAIDFRVGGSYRFVTGGPRGEHGFRGEYSEIVPNERIVQTFEWEGMPGHISRETLTLSESNGQTTMTINCLFGTREERDGMLGSGMEQGAGESYNKLEELLKAGESNA